MQSSSLYPAANVILLYQLELTGYTVKAWKLKMLFVFSTFTKTAE